MICETSRYGNYGWRRPWRYLRMDEEVMNTNLLIAAVEAALAAYVAILVVGKVKAR